MNTPTDSATTEKPDTESPEEKRLNTRCTKALLTLFCCTTVLVVGEVVRTYVKLFKLLGWW